MGKNKPFVPLKNESNSALFSNSILDSLYRGRLHELAMARFKWENLPEEIDQRFLEMTLNEYAMGAFFFDDVAQRYVFLPAMINGDYNIYNDTRRNRRTDASSWLQGVLTGSQRIEQRIGIHLQQLLAQEGFVLGGQLDALQLTVDVAAELLLLLRGVTGSKARGAGCQEVGSHVVARIEAVAGMDAAVYQRSHTGKELGTGQRAG